MTTRVKLTVMAGAAAVVAACGGGGGSDGEPEPVPVPVRVACATNAGVPLSFEEQRLVNRLPGVDVAFARQLLDGTGFNVYGPAFAQKLCATDNTTEIASYASALDVMREDGQKLWRAAVDRVQGRQVAGNLPAGDDRMLYWARLEMTKALRQWVPSFEVTVVQREELEWELERASRGQYEIELPEGTKYRRVIVSGFDPFTLGAPGATDNVNIRIGNPSGAVALALDGKEFTLEDGTIARIEAYTLPVSYGPFQKGMQEDTLGPWFKPGSRRVDASITVSQGGAYRFNLEQWNARYHGGRDGNDGVVVCPAAGSTDRQPATGECDVFPPQRWTGYNAMPWKRDFPAQFTSATTPVARMLGANTGAGIPKPPESGAEVAEGFDVTWGYGYTTFPDCNDPANLAFNAVLVLNDLPSFTPVPPDPTHCSRRGGGGDYLSNESAYRNTLMRDIFKLNIPAGHIHVPVMTRFQTGNDSVVTDAKYEAYRGAIVEQTTRLIRVVADSLVLQ